MSPIATFSRGEIAQRLRYRVRLHWTEGPVIAGTIFVVLLLIHNSYQPVFSAFQLQAISNDSTTLALAAIGETLVILTGGFDLSPGAVLALVNVLLATKLNGSVGHDLVLVLSGLGVGLGAGLVNGFLVAFMRLQSIIVTVATLFIFGGLALLVLKQPGGSVPTGYVDFLSGSIGSFPRSLIVVFGATAVWLLVKRTPFGKTICAIGSDPVAAHMSGVPVRWALLATYGLAGLFYGAAGVYVTAQTVSGDPRIGASFLLATFIAVVIGGTRLGGGYGSAVGSVMGAFIVTLIIDVLFDLNVNSFYTGIVEGAVLIAAVFVSSLARRFRPRRLVSTRTARARV